MTKKMETPEGDYSRILEKTHRDSLIVRAKMLTPMEKAKKLRTKKNPEPKEESGYNGKTGPC